jgi:hypothetical protein
MNVALLHADDDILYVAALASETTRAILGLGRQALKLQAISHQTLGSWQ